MKTKNLIMEAANHFKKGAWMLVILLISFSACTQTTVTIVNPYADVNWATFGQFKTALHMHTTNSDGGHTVAEMVEEHFQQGFSIIALTDHNVLTPSMDGAKHEPDRTPPRIPVTPERRAEIEAGVGRDGKGMIAIYNTNEHSFVHHVNSFFADFTSERGQSLEYILGRVEELGGISRLNHPGRYVVPRALVNEWNFEEAFALAREPETVQRYVDWFMNFPSNVGMEIVNRLDFETIADRVLWDEILMQTMPQGRPVWGFADDDSHSRGGVGYAFNMFLMPELNQENFRTVMETGAFYAVSRVSRADGINIHMESGELIPLGGRFSTPDREGTEFMLLQTTPSISNIEVNERRATITISGADYDIIEWIADGVVIATGATLRLLNHKEEINSYVRAQLRSETGIAFTQPFGVNISR